MRVFHLRAAGAKWRLSGEGADRTLCDFDTIGAAVRRCRELIGTHPGALNIYDGAGRLTEVVESSGDLGGLSEDCGYETK